MAPSDRTAMRAPGIVGVEPAQRTTVTMATGTPRLRSSIRLGSQSHKHMFCNGKVGRRKPSYARKAERPP